MASFIDFLQSSYAIAGSGLETTLLFREKIDLPCFAAFHQWNNDQGRECISRYLSTHIELAKKFKVNCMLETPTWRGSPKWGNELGYTQQQIFEFNKNIAEVLNKIRSEQENDTTKIIICGVIGPRGDGYTPTEVMTVEEAESYHSIQISALVEGGVDLVISYTLNYPEEAIGIVKASKSKKINVAISFTVETDSNLACGLSIKDFISTVDSSTEGGPLYYMINCSHLSHFRRILEENHDQDWIHRIMALSPNASRKSHEELNNSTELDDGNPEEFGRELKEIKDLLPHLRIFGGCCGTDLRHIEKVCEACFS